MDEGRVVEPLRVTLPITWLPMDIISAAACFRIEELPVLVQDQNLAAGDCRLLQHVAGVVVGIEGARAPENLA